jgi:hypothetical protein
MDDNIITHKYGPLPGWAWGLIIVGLGIVYFKHRANQQAAAQAASAAQNNASNLGSVPVSNLTTQAQPMPIQLGDTFVNSGGQTGTNSTSPTLGAPQNSQPAANLNPAATPAPPSAPVPSPAASAGQTPGTGTGG